LSRKNHDEEAARRRRNLAGPSESELDWARNDAPEVRDQHEMGDTERAEGGQTVTWLNDKCHFTPRGPTAIGIPDTKKVCKDPPKPDDPLFKDLREKLDEQAAKRLP
jgi:hypothetical protein